MTDIVLKVSLPGFDVKTASPEECAIHSDYDTLKLKLDNDNPYFQRISVDFNTNPPLGTINIFTFEYDLPNVPAYYFMFDQKDSAGGSLSEYGNQFPIDATFDHVFQATRVGNKISFDLITDATGIDLVGKYYEFRFYCYANDGL